MAIRNIIQYKRLSEGLVACLLLQRNVLSKHFSSYFLLLLLQIRINLCDSLYMRNVFMISEPQIEKEGYII